MHLGQTRRLVSRSVRYSTASHDGHFTHKPSGIDLREAESERWMRGGSNFSSQLMGTSSIFFTCALYRLSGNAPKKRTKGGYAHAACAICFIGKNVHHSS